MAIAQLNFDNIIQRIAELESIMQFDADNRLRYRAFMFPHALIAQLERYIKNLDDKDLEYDNDGRVLRVHDDDALNGLLLTMFNVELEERRFTVTVSFTVDAHTATQAKEIIENAIEWCNYDIESVDD